MKIRLKDSDSSTIEKVEKMNETCSTSNPVSESAIDDDILDSDWFEELEERSNESFQNFFENHNLYNNPIDKYYLPKIYSLNTDTQTQRKLRVKYKKAWEKEYKNFIKWLKKQCTYKEDIEDIKVLNQRVIELIEAEKNVLKTAITDSYQINPDPSKVKDHFTRVSNRGHGLMEHLGQREVETYRNLCMKVIESYSGNDSYVFLFDK